MPDPVWTHRPTVEEHEDAVRAQREAGYPSMSAFVREAVLRLTYADDSRPIFTELVEITELVREGAQRLQEVEKCLNGQ